MMARVSRSRRVVKTLTEVDPDFRDLVGMLYGPDVDADAVWSDVFDRVSKANPTSSDVSTPGNPGEPGWKRKAAIAGIAAGTLLGAKELGNELPKLGGPVGRGAGKVMSRVNQGGKLIPLGARNVLTSPGGKVATGATAIGADVLGIDELRQQKRQQRQATSKAMPSVGQMSEGLQRGWKALIPTDHPVVQQMLGRSKSAGANAKSGFSRSRTGGLLGKPKAGQADSGSFQLGQAAGNLVNAATANTGTKIGTGVAATGLAGHAYGTHQRNKAAQASYGDPYSYGKADDAEVIWKGTFTEVDPDKQLAFGWASVVEMNGMPVIDRQGDVITPDDMEDAAYAYVLKSRKGGNMHARAADGGPHQVSQMVESFVVTDEKVEKMGLPEDTPRGWWVGFQIHDPDTWAMIRSGERTGFSIHGHGRRTEVPVDSVMGYA